MKCEICGKEFKKLTRHIPMHGITTEEYYDRYLGKPKYCPVCGNKTVFKGLNVGYTTYCSRSCASKDLCSDEKFRKENGQRISKAWHSKTKKEQDKIKEHISEGTKQGMAKMDKEKYSKTCSEAQKRRWKNISKEDYDRFRENLKEALKDYDREIASQKRKKTNMEKYGVENAHNEEVKKKCEQTTYKKYGVRHAFQIPEVRAAMYRANKNKSSLEVKFEEKCKELNIDYKVQGETKDSRYPYFYDFYLPDTDTFIEINGYWTHSNHWFNKNNPDDLKKVNRWKKKGKLGQDQYNYAIEVWTKRDVEKRETARKNELNYVVLWSDIDIDLWFKMGCPDGRDWLEEYTWLPF